MVRLAASLIASTLVLAGCQSAAPVPPVPTQKPETVAAPEPVTGPGDRIDTGRGHGVRSAVVAPNAAAATAHPLATRIALETMQSGGSAVDAAIAANAMLGLAEPTGNGIGGDLYALVWDPETQTLYGYNGAGRSPMGATLEDMQAAADAHEGGEIIPPFGAAPVSVPGTVDGWFALHERFGKLPMSAVLKPTIQYAETGVGIPEVIAYYWGRNEVRLAEAYESGMLEEFDNARATYFSPTPREGAIFRNPDLGRTYQLIADEGRDAFYKGEIAQTIDAYMQRIGGYLRYEDFASHEGNWTEPLCVPYRETRVCEIAENTQGVAVLQMLQMLEGFPMREFGYGSPDSLMAQVEAKRLAFSDRAAGYADPEFSRIPPEVFINPSIAASRADKIDLESAASPAPVGEFWKRTGDFVRQIESPEGAQQFESLEAYVASLLEADTKLQNGDTTFLVTADADGMMVALIQSNYRGMGSGLVPDGLGFMLQDRGQLFSLDPAHPNVFEPGKRPFTTIIPAFAFKHVCFERGIINQTEDGLENDTFESCGHMPWLAFGVMGGGMQPQGHVQIILNLIDHDMGLQEAGDAARWRHDGGCEPTAGVAGDACESDMGVVNLESGIPGATARELEARGHSVRYTRSGFGGYQAIMRDFESGAWIAATELRKDGSADGY